jgi:hypothetical protein
MNKSNLGIIIILFLLLYSCEKNTSRCFTGAGNETEEERILGRFSYIYVNDIFDLVLVQDSVNKVILKGGENLLPNVSTEVYNDTLIIENSTICNWLRDYEKIEITVHFIDLRHLITFAPVRITSSDTLMCEYFKYYAIGEIGEADLILNCGYFRFDDSYNTLGQFRFSGKTEMSRFFINYGSSLYAGNLISENTDIYFQTIGDMYIHVTGQLRIWIWGPGNVYYSGNPDTVEVMERKSTGRIIKLD